MFRKTIPCALLCALLTACNTPTLEFAGADVTTVQVGQSRFDVRIKRARAQAIRTNREWAPNWKFTVDRFMIAFTVATGCNVTPNQIRGDQALMEATITNCTPRPQPLRNRKVGDYTCQPENGVMVCTKPGD